MRSDQRKEDQIRPVRISRNYLKYPQGSVLIEMGDTKVICSASVEENVPNFKRGLGGGWVTAEYSMLPGSTAERTQREFNRSRGRSQEIQRLIGRSLRAVTDLNLLGERTVIVDADVMQADGGTRTAAITGSYVALYDALNVILKEGKIEKNPLKEFLAAVSVGVVGDSLLLDLNYSEDVSAKVDMNVVMTESGKFVEVQGTAEGEPFSHETLNNLLALASQGINKLISEQKRVLGQ
jgi:ribonuclease PH